MPVDAVCLASHCRFGESSWKIGSRPVRWVGWSDDFVVVIVEHSRLGSLKA